MTFEEAKRHIEYLPIDIEEFEYGMIKVTIKETVYFTDLHGLDLLIHAATGMFYHGYQLGHDIGMNEAKQ